MQTLRLWLGFFFGTPQRFVATAFFVGLVVVIVDPQLLDFAVRRLIVAATPVVPIALAIAIVFAGIGYMFKGGGGKK